MEQHVPSLVVFCFMLYDKHAAGKQRKETADKSIEMEFIMMKKMISLLMALTLVLVTLIPVLAEDAPEKGISGIWTDENFDRMELTSSLPKSPGLTNGWARG